MLVNFFVEPTAIPTDGGTSRAARTQLLDHLMNHGVRAGTRNQWMSIIERIPQSERKQWEVMLERTPFVEVDMSFDRPESSSAVLDSASESIVTLSQTSYLEWARHHEFEPTPEEERFKIQQIPPPNLAEIVTLPFLPESEVIERRRSWNETGIPKGTDREAIWSERLLPMLRHCSMLHIIDRFFLSALASGARCSNPKRDSGPFWLASKFESDLCEQPISLHLYTNRLEDSLESSQLEFLEGFRATAPRGIREISYYLPQNGSRLAVPHDRHWRGGGTLWAAKIEFGSSIDMFDSRMCSQNHQMRAFVLARETRRVLMDQERALRDQCPEPIRIP